MRILLRNFVTGRYLGRGGVWTNKPALAMTFLNEVKATAYKLQHQLANTFVVVLPPPKALGNPQSAKG